MIKVFSKFNWIVIISILFLVCVATVQNSNKLFKPLDRQKVSDLYANALYVLRDASTFFVADVIVYDFAGIV